MMTADLLNRVYENTSCATRVSLDGGLRNEKGERFNVIHEILSILPYNGSHFGVWLIHSDGGVKNMAVTYQLGDYTVIVDRFTLFGNEPKFSNVEEFATWLNAHEAKIRATGMLVSLETKQ